MKFASKYCTGFLGDKEHVKSFSVCTILPEINNHYLWTNNAIEYKNTIDMEQKHTGSPGEADGATE